MKMMSVRQLLITFVPSLSILAALVVVKVLFQATMFEMTSDVAAIAKIHPLSGILSNTFDTQNTPREKPADVRKGASPF